MKSFPVILFLLMPLFINAQSREVPFTQDDRDRIIRLEERMTALEKSMNEKMAALEKSINERITASENLTNEKFESVNANFDHLFTLIYFVLGGMLSLVGFVLWDRRSYVKPVKDDMIELKDILKEYAKKQPELAEILRIRGIL